MIEFIKNIFKKKEKAYNDLSINEFKEAFKTNSLIVDVRTPKEFNAGKIPNSKNINVASLDFLKEARDLDSSKNILVYCKSGGRSARAANMLTKIGFSQVSNLIGGIDSWKSQGEKVE